MTRKELQHLLNQFPENMPVKLHVGKGQDGKPCILPFDEDRLILSSDSFVIDETAPEEEWDMEDGKSVLTGEKFILVNPIII